MNSYEVMNLFADQIKRHLPEETKAKVITTPSSVKEKGVTVRISLLKTSLGMQSPAARNIRTARLRLQVSGTAESTTGLKQAVEMIEAVDRYLKEPRTLERAEETKEGVKISPIPNTRILQQVSQEDSFVSSPDSTEAQDVDDNRIITINFQEE